MGFDGITAVSWLAGIRFLLDRFRFVWNWNSLPFAALEREFHCLCFRQNLNRFDKSNSRHPAKPRKSCPFANSVPPPAPSAQICHTLDNYLR